MSSPIRPPRVPLTDAIRTHIAVEDGIPLMTFERSTETMSSWDPYVSVVRLSPDEVRGLIHELGILLDKAEAVARVLK